MSDVEIRRLKAREYYKNVYREKKLKQVRAWQEKNKEKVREYLRVFRRREAGIV